MPQLWWFNNNNNKWTHLRFQLKVCHCFHSGGPEGARRGKILLCSVIWGIFRSRGRLLLQPGASAVWNHFRDADIVLSKLLVSPIFIWLKVRLLQNQQSKCGDWTCNININANNNKINVIIWHLTDLNTHTTACCVVSIRGSFTAAENREETYLHTQWGNLE